MVIFHSFFNVFGMLTEGQPPIISRIHRRQGSVDEDHGPAGSTEPARADEGPFRGRGLFFGEVRVLRRWCERGIKGDVKHQMWRPFTLIYQV